METGARDYASELRKQKERRQQELKAIEKFHDFLQGVVPDGVSTRRFKKMNADQAFTVVWFLQEVCHLLPDQYEMCHNCKTIYDSYSEGRYDEEKGLHYCGSCEFDGQ